MVCVTQQKTCKKLIDRGLELKEDKDNLYVINVVKENENFLYNSSEGEALEFLFGISRKAGAELMVIKAKDAIKAMVDFARENSISHIVLGASSDIRDEENHPIVAQLKKYFSKKERMEYIVV